MSTIYSKLFKRPKSNLKKSICLKKLNTLLSGINWKCLLFLKSPENNTIWQFQEKNPLNLLASKLFFKHFKMKTCLKTCTLMFWITTLCTNVVQRDTKGDAYAKLLNVHMYIHFSEYKKKKRKSGKSGEIFFKKIPFLQVFLALLIVLLSPRSRLSKLLLLLKIKLLTLLPGTA